MQSSPLASQCRIICSGFVFDHAAEAVIRRHAPKGLDLTFAERPEDVSPAMLAVADVLLTEAPATDDMMRAAPRLRFIQKWGTGYEKIDTVALRGRRVGPRSLR